MSFQWDESYATGVNLVDQQHKKLFEMINRFYSALHEKRPQEALQQLLAGLLDYTKYHFTTEEELMAKNSYLLSTDHINEHREFMVKAADWQKRATSGQLIISMEVTNYLRDWLVDHISKKDKALGSYLKSKHVN